MVAPARSIFSFASWDTDHPSERPPGDRLDAQFAELLRGQALILEQLDAVARSQAAVEGLARHPAPFLTAAPNALGYAAGGFYATDQLGADATAADYAQVSIDWAEHMPDTIPPNTLAINAITGDHWSSRWWANKAANLLATLMQGGLSVYAEPLTVVSPNALSSLTYAPVDNVTTMELIVNGRVFPACATGAAFSVVGKTVSWTSAIFGLAVGDEVVARYRFAAGPPTSATAAATTLHYLATTGQTAFSTTTPDRFARSYTLHPTSAVQVSRNGQRLMPDDGSGKGSFSVSGNVVTLFYPAGVDETIIIDVLEPIDVGGGSSGWWTSLPTTLPSTPGVLWNNGGVISVS